MLVITPNNITDLPGNSGIVIVLDHQPAPLNPSIEADFETSSIYCDQPYNSIEQIITQLKNEGYKEKDFVVLKKDSKFGLISFAT